MNDLRSVFPTRIVRGALLRPDGVAVGLVGGGAPSWALRSLAGRAQAGSDYHRLLLALDGPIDVYLVDQPPDVAGAIARLTECQDHGASPILAEVLCDLADYLAELSQQSGSRAKQVVWAVTAGASAGVPVTRRMDLGVLLPSARRGRPGQPATAGAAALGQAVAAARRLVDALAQLGGVPPARLLEAEEIARLIYGLADLVRAQRYPLDSMLLDRVRQVMTTREAP